MQAVAEFESRTVIKLSAFVGHTHSHYSFPKIRVPSESVYPGFKTMMSVYSTPYEISPDGKVLIADFVIYGISIGEAKEEGLDTPLMLFLFGFDRDSKKMIHNATLKIKYRSLNYYTNLEFYWPVKHRQNKKIIMGKPILTMLKETFILSQDFLTVEKKVVLDIPDVEVFVFHK